MTGNVISLKGGAIENERREAFMRAVATSYDLYAESYGHDPDALVYVLCGIKQPSQIAWEIQGESQGGPLSVLAIAAVHCQAEAAQGRQGLE